MIFWFCPFSRLSEQSKLMADHRKLVAEITKKYQSLEEWNLKHKVCIGGRG